MGVGRSWGASDRPINGENGLNPVTRYGENAFLKGLLLLPRHKIPLMPRSRIDRRKTKPTTEERNGNFNCAKERNAYSIPFSSHPTFSTSFFSSSSSGLFSDLDGNVLFISACFITPFFRVSLPQLEVKIKRTAFNAGIAALNAVFHWLCNIAFSRKISYFKPNSKYESSKHYKIAIFNATKGFPC